MGNTRIVLVRLRKRTSLHMKWFAYLLIPLLLSTQVGDALAVAADEPSAPLVDDDDEFLPVQRRPREEESVPDPGQIVVRLNPPTANHPPARRGRSFEWDPTTPFAPPPLYVFMSLQT